MSSLFNHKFIVFSGEHYNPLGVIRSLGEKGIKPVAIVLSGGAPLTSKSKYISKLHLVGDREEGFRILMEEYADSQNPPFVYCCDDRTISFVDHHYQEMEGKFYFFNAGSEGRINQFLNKENIGKLALKHGLNFLPEIVVDKGIVPDNLSYPVLTKAIDSTENGWKNDMFICHSDSELQIAFQKIKSPRVMIQKYIKKKNEYCLEGFSCNRGQDVFISIESIYDYRLPMSYSPYMTANNFSNKNNVFPSLQGMFAEIGFEGIFEVEFLEAKDGTLYFGEINFRNSTWSYASTCGGMNLPYLWAESMLQGHQADNCYCEIPKPGFKAMVETTDFKERVIKRKYPLVKWLKDLHNSKCKYYIGRNDFAPVISEVGARLLHKQ